MGLDRSSSPNRRGNWTVTQLKNELRQRELSPAGTKSELIARLEEHDASTPPTATKAPRRGRSMSRRVMRRAVSPTSKSPLRSVSGKPDHGYLTESQSKETLDGHRTSPRGRQREIAGKLQGNPFMETPIPTVDIFNSRLQEPRSRSTSKTSPGSGRLTADDISLVTSPLLTLRLFFGLCIDMLSDAARCLCRHPFALGSVVGLSGLLIGFCMAPGSHQVWVDQAKSSASWYGRWIFLGVMSSIGLGTGLHTFLLFLGPMIARTTTIASNCNNLNFAINGPAQFVCTKIAVKDFGLLDVVNKIKWEAFAWGLGTAVGELPPYLIARASAAAGKASGELKEIEQLLAKKRRTLFESAKVHSYRIVSKLGFAGILLLASIPNPLFDLAGLICGYFMVPFWTFVGATFIGKAIIKTALQSVFVIVLFSKDTLEAVLQVVQSNFPVASGKIQSWLIKQKSIYMSKAGISDEMNLIQAFFNGIILLMMLYFVLSVVRSAAVTQAKRRRMLASAA